MKLNIIIFLGTLTLLTSCNGQATNQQVKIENIVKGDAVTELGNSITVIYQDKKIPIGLVVGKQECINTIGRKLLIMPSKKTHKTYAIYHLQRQQWGPLAWNIREWSI